jgi:hypothetical protein
LNTRVTAESSDPLFTEPYVDVDEWRDEPVLHRCVHGGFKGTDARFSIYFPPKEQYEGRFFQYIQPISGDEYTAEASGAQNSSYSIGFAIDSGGYLVISNLGRMDMFTGDDPTIVGYRTSAAVAKYSRVLASEMYGNHRPYGYAWGGSGGAYKTISCIENTDGVWDGVVPFIHATPVAIPHNFSVQAHAMRVLEDKMPAIVDAVEPGGSGDMYAGLNEEERAALIEVTKMGFPPRAWFHYRMIAFGYTGVLTTLFDQIIKTDPTYVDDFWKVPGYLGADPPESLLRRRLHHETTISKLLMPSDLKEMGIPVSYSAEASTKVPSAFIMKDLLKGDLQGASIFLKSGDAVGCVLYIAGAFDNMVMIAFGQDNFLRLPSVKVGDKVEIDNSVYLAFQSYHRHQLPSREYYVFDQFRDTDGKPLYPQRPQVFKAETGAGSIQTGLFNGKMIIVQMITDEIAYAWQADWYRTKVKAALGERLNDNYRLWFIDNALHTPPVITPLDSPPVITTRIINYGGVLQQALRDLSAWVEKGVAPPTSTLYKVVDGQVQVPPKAAERKGIQPVVTVEANGRVRADVKVGQKVKFSAVIEAPPGAGSIVGAEWDFEGNGDYPTVQKLKDTKSNRVKVETTYTFSEGGTYFPAVRVTLHRQGDPQTPYARVQNIGRVRVVVTGDEKKGKSKDKELITELKKIPADFQQFMDEFVEKTVQQVTVVQGTEISTIEVGPRTDRSTKFQITPFIGEAFYSISFDNMDAGIGVFLELEIEVTGAYRLAKKTIQKAVSKSIAENTIKVLDEILE